MGKVCWINGQPYLVSLPMGERSPYDLNSPWDDLINFLGEGCDKLFHWDEMYSLCQETVDSSYHTVRGYYSARSWNNYSASFRSVLLGFRPVLVPLDPDTMKPDVSLLEDIPDGTRIALTSLYMDGKVIPEPQNPMYDGNIMDYIPGAEIILGDRDRDSKNWLHVIKYKDLLWMDRNILKNISCEDLERQGYAGEQ